MLKKILLKLNILLLILMMLMQTGCGKTEEPWTGYTKQSFYFDTICEVTVLGFNEGVLKEDTEEAFMEEAESVITDTFSLLSDYEKMLSRTVESSDISRINDSEGEAVSVNPETLEVINKGIEFGELSGGVFDITVGKASELWDFHESITDEPSKVPDAADLAEAAKHIDYKGITVDSGASSVKLSDPEMLLDLGGIAKGYIADKAAEYLRSRGVSSAIVNLGGNIEVVGGKSQGFHSGDQAQVDFNLGIRDPESETGGLLGIYPGKDMTIVTSGTYERFIEVDGVKYHHILDPETGYPVDTDVLQVSILAGSGHSVDCDGLSTVCLALGSQAGTELIRRLDSEGTYGNIEAIFVTTDGEIIYTKEDTAFIAN